MTPQPMTQMERVLVLLRRAGSDGVHSFTLRREHYIANPSQRILELQAAGHEITGEREKLNGNAVGVRYRLVREAVLEANALPRPFGGAPAAAVPAPSADTRGETLFGTTAPATPVARPSAYDPFSEAA